MSMSRQEQYNSAVEDRARQITGVVATRTKSMWGAHAVMAEDGDGERTSELIFAQLGKEATGPFARVAMGTFETLAAVALVRRWGEGLPVEAVERVRHLMTDGVLHRGNTENHWLMFYTAQILALEHWPEIDPWWNGQPRQVAHAALAGVVAAASAGFCSAVCEPAVECVRGAFDVAEAMVVSVSCVAMPIIMVPSNTAPIRNAANSANSGRAVPLESSPKRWKQHLAEVCP